MAETRILVVRPKTLSVRDKRLLADASIFVVESENPEDVRLLSTESPPMDGAALFRAAMYAIGENTKNGGGSGKLFAEQVAAMLRASEGIPS